MKLLILIIAVIIMSFSEAIYANQNINGSEIKVELYQDPELLDLRNVKDQTDAISRSTDEKIDLVNDIMTTTTDLVPKQVEVLLIKQKFQDLIKARDKYMLCLERRNQDCSKLKENFESLNMNSSKDHKIDEPVNNFEITNPYIIGKIKECSVVTKEFFPDFIAAIKLDFTIDDQGRPMSVFVNQEKSSISHDLFMFSKCVEHFARKLHFSNESKKIATFTKNFIL